MTTTTTTTTAITEAQLAKCARIIDEQTGLPFYRVESESDSSVEYTVRYSKATGYTCTCPAGERGFASCTHNRYCKHVRWSIAHAQEFKAEQVKAAHVEKLMTMGLTMEEAKAASNAHVEIAGHLATDEELVRIYGPRNRRPSEAEIEQDARRYAAYNKPFSLLK